MAAAIGRRIKSFMARLARSPIETLLIAVAFAIGGYVVAYPLAVVYYPPITDLPFHAACTSVLRHYFDPGWHFREQFTLHMLESPYWMHWGLGALLALLMPIVPAVKLSTVVMLAMLPVGLAVMFHGMRKSPLLGLTGLWLVWTTLTHWGFINFMAAIGMFAMVVGFTLLTLDRGDRSHKIGLALSLLAVFGTHIFRFPFALAAVVGTTLVMAPATRKWKPVLLPLVPSFVALGVWLSVRKKELSADGMEPLKPHFDRLAEVPTILFNAFAGVEERQAANLSLTAILAVFAVCTAFFFIERRWRGWQPRDRWWAAGVTLLPICLSFVFLAMYLVLPMAIGIWWYVYPREIVAAAFLLVGVIPNLPKPSLAKLPAVLALGLTAGNQALFVARNYHDFDAHTEDFRRIVSHLPQAPKLGYMVFDHSGTNRVTTPFIHLPAWVQAEKGGWLSFHFLAWNVAPIRYRDNSPNVPPPFPLRFEWEPQRFDVATRGKFFDWFLIRSPGSPDYKMRVDPSLKLVDHQGMWWLYHRAAPDQPGN